MAELSKSLPLVHQAGSHNNFCISHGGMIIQLVEKRFVVAIRLSISFDFDTSHTSRPGLSVKHCPEPSLSAVNKIPYYSVICFDSFCIMAGVDQKLSRPLVTELGKLSEIIVCK